MNRPQSKPALRWIAMGMGLSLLGIWVLLGDFTFGAKRPDVSTIPDTSIPRESKVLADQPIVTEANDPVEDFRSKYQRLLHLRSAMDRRIRELDAAKPLRKKAWLYKASGLDRYGRGKPEGWVKQIRDQGDEIQAFLKKVGGKNAYKELHEITFALAIQNALQSEERIGDSQLRTIIRDALRNPAYYGQFKRRILGLERRHFPDDPETSRLASTPPSDFIDEAVNRTAKYQELWDEIFIQIGFPEHLREGVFLPTAALFVDVALDRYIEDESEDLQVIRAEFTRVAAQMSSIVNDSSTSPEANEEILAFMRNAEATWMDKDGLSAKLVKQLNGIFSEHINRRNLKAASD